MALTKSNFFTKKKAEPVEPVAQDDAARLRELESKDVKSAEDYAEIMRLRRPGPNSDPVPAT